MRAFRMRRLCLNTRPTPFYLPPLRQLPRIDRLQLSARSYSWILIVSRTIADFAASPSIELEHIAEAVSLR